MSEFDQTVVLLIRIALVGTIVVAGFCAAPGFAATISRTADVEILLTTMWSMMGPAGSLRNWLAPLLAGGRGPIGQVISPS